MGRGEIEGGVLVVRHSERSACIVFERAFTGVRLSWTF